MYIWSYPGFFAWRSSQDMLDQLVQLLPEIWKMLRCFSPVILQNQAQHNSSRVRSDTGVSPPPTKHNKRKHTHTHMFTCSHLHLQKRSKAKVKTFSFQGWPCHSYAIPMPSGFDPMPFQTEGLQPGKLTAGSPRIHLHLKSGKSSEPNLHCWIQNVNFPRCTHLKFNSSPLKSYLPKKESSLPSIIFQGRKC